MRLSTKLLAAAAAVSMTAAPVAAQTTPAATADARAGAEMDQASALRGGFLIPLIAIIAIILGILAATQDNDDDLPHSP